MPKLTVGLCLLWTVGLLAVTGQSARAEPWPRFRGPHGTGIASDKEIPLKWSDQDGIRWKVRIPGVGHSSPIVWGNRLFLQSASEDARERSLLCLDAGTGKILWTRTVVGTNNMKHPKNTLASSTPATDGERVYVVFWDGAKLLLHAYDFEGNLVWDRDLGLFNTTPKTDRHGAGNSPVVYGGKVIYANDQTGTAELLAFHAKTGKSAWQATRRAFRACYSTPFLLEKPGQPPELIVSSTAGVTSYDVQTGKANWDWTWTFDKLPLRTVGSPLYTDGLIIANSGDGGGDRHTVAVKTGGTGLGWEIKRTLPYVPTMLTWDKHLYYVNDKGFAGCMVAATGETVWTERLGGDVMASPILIDGKIYAIDEEGRVFVYAAAPVFKLLARTPMGEPVMATPAVADNRLYIRGHSHLYCIGKAPEKRAARP
jgi:outer membrane protein assembly factor BamB